MVLGVQTLTAGFRYFALTFAAGFVFGTIRTLWVIPMFSVRTAELLETPFMLVVIVLAARWTVRESGGQPGFPRLRIGLIALGFLLVAELTMVLGWQRLTIREYVASRDPVAGTVYLVMLVIFAVMPLLVARS